MKCIKTYMSFARDDNSAGSGIGRRSRPKGEGRDGPNQPDAGRAQKDNYEMATSIKTIAHALNNKIQYQSMICTDKEKLYLKFTKKKLNLLELNAIKQMKEYIIKSHQYLSYGIEKFIGNFNETSKKYLNNYLAWNSVIKENISSIANYI